jgi:hypothetical protein
MVKVDKNIKGDKYLIINGVSDYSIVAKSCMRQNIRGVDGLESIVQ